MMTKRHYVTLAAGLADIESPLIRSVAAHALGRSLKRDNPRFNLDTWLAACGVVQYRDLLPEEVTKARVMAALERATEQA
jgi:hypothetical protein